MKRALLLASFAYFSTSYASSLIAPRAAAPGVIRNECTNVRVEASWLIGDCLTGDGSTRITSGTYLLNKISNDDGTLTWKNDGFYGRTCFNCELRDGGSNLHCQCQPNFGQRKDTTLALDKHIGVYAGHLLSNLKSAPIAPSSPSEYEFPGDRRYGIGGNATCPTSGRDWCKSVARLCSDTPGDDFGEAFIQNIAPISDCYVPSFYFPDHIPFHDFKAVSYGAWEIVGYADERCTKKLVTISPEDMGKCETMEQGEFVRGITARPLFNGDPN